MWHIRTLCAQIRTRTPTHRLDDAQQTSGAEVKCCPVVREYWEYCKPTVHEQERMAYTRGARVGRGKCSRLQVGLPRSANDACSALLPATAIAAGDAHILERT